MSVMLSSVAVRSVHAWRMRVSTIYAVGVLPYIVVKSRAQCRPDIPATAASDASEISFAKFDSICAAARAMAGTVPLFFACPNDRQSRTMRSAKSDRSMIRYPIAQRTDSRFMRCMTATASRTFTGERVRRQVNCSSGERGASTNSVWNAASVRMSLPMRRNIDG